jgi:acetyltransferase-like isoleucine patch superfamily enzyme
MEILIEKDTALTSKEKKMFGMFGEGAKIRPPFRILNPQNVYIGNFVSIREFSYIHAYENLTKLYDFIDEKYKCDFDPNDYKYKSKIIIGDEVQIGRNLFISCTNRIEIGRNTTISERVFIGDNQHSFSHPEVPIMQQPNKRGIAVHIGKGSWIGAGASILPGTRLGKNNVCGTNAVIQGEFPDYAVIGNEKAKVLFIKKFE